MFPRNAAVTENSSRDDPLGHEDGDESDSAEARGSVFPSTVDDRSRDELFESQRSSSWVLASRLIRRIRSLIPMLFTKDDECSQRCFYNAAPATGAAQCQAGPNPSGMNDCATSGLHTSIIFTVQTIVCYSWANLLLVFVPIAIGTYLTKANPFTVFTCNAIAIVPLSGLLTYATESIARDMGDTVGALLNISFGNLVEVVILAALVDNQIRIVQASLLGSILVNLLLILGTAIIAGSSRHQEQAHNVDDAQALACLLCLSVFSLLIPTAFYHSFNNVETADQAVLKLSRASALTLLVIYCLYVLFQLKPHASLISSVQPQGADIQLSTRFSIRRSHDNESIVSSLSRIIRFEDEESRPSIDSGHKTKQTIELDMIDAEEPPALIIETSVHSDEEDPKDDADQPRRGRQNNTRHQNTAPGVRTSIYQAHLRATSSASRHSLPRFLSQDTRRQSPVGSTSSLPLLLGRPRRSFDYPSNASISSNAPVISRTASLVLLVICSTLVAICAEFLVSTIDDMATHGPVSETFIGLIILPIAGNCAEHITAMTVAAKNKMDLAIGVSVGSSIQIALFVTPLVVIVGWVLDRDMTMYFSLFETVTLVATAFLVNFLLLNGRTNFLEGSLLCGCYIIIGVGAYLFPGPQGQAPDGS